MMEVSDRVEKDFNLRSPAGEDGDADIPTAIPVDGVNIHADTSAASVGDGNPPLSPLAATTVRSSPFKKNHKV